MSLLGHRFNETTSAQGRVIGSHRDFEWGHCGRENSPSGTEGSFEVRFSGTNQKIGEVYWDCPYIGDNRVISHNMTAGYDISIDNFSIPDGALGKGRISIRQD